MLYETKASAGFGAGRSASVLVAGNNSTPPLEELEKHLEGARTHIGVMIETACSIADKLTGGGGADGNTGPEHPPRSGRLGSLVDRAAGINNALDELERQISRIAQIG